MRIIGQPTKRSVSNARVINQPTQEFSNVRVINQLTQEFSNSSAT
jgi:hypothetical protein